MPWIVKNSATAQIERREEPYLDDQMKAALDAEVLPRYPTRRAATLPVLQAIVHKHGWIPHQAIEEAADYIGISAAEMLDTASFYEEFWLEPKGKYLIMVCRSLSCELMGYIDLLAHIKAKLGIEEGQTTDDGKITLVAAECLGSCDTAPCALANEKLHENLTVERIDEILDSLD